MTPQHSINVAVLDDYQGLALNMLDWSKLVMEPILRSFKATLVDA
jgi:hypothetical protein